MPESNLNYYFIKITRISGWALLVVMLLCIGSGLSMCSRLGFDRLFDPHAAEQVHKDFSWPLIVLTGVHSAAAVYVAFRRWGWIGKEQKA